jgi:hypothetical protein
MSSLPLTSIFTTISVDFVTGTVVVVVVVVLVVVVVVVVDFVVPALGVGSDCADDTLLLSSFTVEAIACFLTVDDSAAEFNMFRLVADRKDSAAAKAAVFLSICFFCSINKYTHPLSDI